MDELCPVSSEGAAPMHARVNLLAAVRPCGCGVIAGGPHRNPCAARTTPAPSAPTTKPRGPVIKIPSSGPKFAFG
jgi:hypothetical protein